MTEEQPAEGVTPPIRELRLLATPADLDAVDFEAPICNVETCDAHDFFPVYERAFLAAREADNEPAQVVYRLFHELCVIMLHVSDRANVWGPLWTRGITRSCIPDDLRGAQTAALSGIVGRIINPGLRARVADIAWTNNRRDGASAAAAIVAYCESVDGLLDGRWKTNYERSATSCAIPFVHRALQIARLTTKRKSPFPDKLLEAFDALYNAARDQADIATFVEIADLGLLFGLRQPAVVAPELETLATNTSTPYPIPIKRAWDLAAGLYLKLNDKDARRRCLIAAVHQTLAMRNDVKGSAAAEAA